MISLDEMKNYLRIDFDDDGTLLENLIVSSERLCMDIARIKSKAVFEKKETAKIAGIAVFAFVFFFCIFRIAALQCRELLAAYRAVSNFGCCNKFFC